MKKAIVFCLLGTAAVVPVCGYTISGNYTGTTNYVSKSGNDANNGKSWATAKKTIQAAVNLCNDGDTVIVDDGEYSDTTAWTVVNSGTTYNNPTVVQITKRIHLVSRNGKHKTHIVGQLANTSSGVANDGTAHRCIYVNNVAKARKSGDYMPVGDLSSIPDNLSVGKNLRDTEIKVKVLTVFTATNIYNNRRVTVEENIEVPAGSFECFLFEDDEFFTGAGPFHVKTWVARGIGIVKQIIYKKDGSVNQIFELIK